MMQPLDDVLVLDFSTLLPGPMATLMLAEAGAEVVKLERPTSSGDARAAAPRLDGPALNYTLLNRGKKSIALDLKAEGAVAALRSLVERADVIVEQFRPGVMDRLGLGYQAVRAINPDIIYCSITGYGQTGPKRNMAGHDLNYAGDAGLLSVSSGPADRPTVPPGLIADIGGGSYPAVVNILLALRARDRTGLGAHLDIAMAEGAFAFAYWAFGKGVVLDEPIINGGERLTGGAARYKIYPAADGRLIAVGALEQKFWIAFCDVIGMPAALRDDARDPAATIAEVGRRLAEKTVAQWEPLLAAADCCCTIVKDMREAARDPHFRERRIFDWQVSSKGTCVPALALPIMPAFRAARDKAVPSPDPGAHNAAFGLVSEPPGSASHRIDNDIPRP